MKYSFRLFRRMSADVCIQVDRELDETELNHIAEDLAGNADILAYSDFEEEEATADCLGKSDVDEAPMFTANKDAEQNWQLSEYGGFEDYEENEDEEDAA